MNLILRIFLILVLAFLVLPMLVVVPLSFSSGEVLTLPVPGYSWRWYEDFFDNPRWMLATRNSFVVAALTALLATALGTLAALGLWGGRFTGQRVIYALLASPLAVPVVIVGIAIYFAFAIVGLNGTLTGLVIAHSLLALPFVTVTVAASLRGVDPVLLRAGASLGAGRWMVLRRVIVPLIAPGVGAGAVFAFATSFDELIVALFVAGPEQFTLPRQMLAGVREFLSPTICAAAVVLTVVSLVLLGLSEALRKTAPHRNVMDVSRD